MLLKARVKMCVTAPDFQKNKFPKISAIEWCNRIVRNGWLFTVSKNHSMNTRWGTMIKKVQKGVFYRRDQHQRGDPMELNFECFQKVNGMLPMDRVRKVDGKRFVICLISFFRSWEMVLWVLKMVHFAVSAKFQIICFNLEYLIWKISLCIFIVKVP